MLVLFGVLEGSLIAGAVILLIAGVLYFMFKNRRPSDYVKFEGKNQDIVWSSPNLTTLSSKVDVVVPFTHEAVVVIDGVAENVYPNGRHTLEKKTGYKSQQLQFFFVNKSLVVPIKWGTPSKFDVIDPIFEMPIRIGAHGDAKITVSDSKNVVYKLVGSKTVFTNEDVSDFFRTKIHSDIVHTLATVMKDNKISYLEIASKIKGISKLIEDELKTNFKEFGFNLSDFLIENIFIPEDVYQTFAKDKELSRRLKERELKFKELYENSREDHKDLAQKEIELIKAMKEDHTIVNIEDYHKKS